MKKNPKFPTPPRRPWDPAHPRQRYPRRAILPGSPRARERKWWSWPAQIPSPAPRRSPHDQSRPAPSSAADLAQKALRAHSALPSLLALVGPAVGGGVGGQWSSGSRAAQTRCASPSDLRRLRSEKSRGSREPGRETADSLPGSRWAQRQASRRRMRVFARAASVSC